MAGDRVREGTIRMGPERTVAQAEGAAPLHRVGGARDVPRAMASLGTRRLLQLALAAAWLVDALLQLQPFMFTKGFGQALAATAAGSPAFVADPITWSARLIEGHAASANVAFATIQLLVAAGIAWRPTVKLALAASVCWSLGVWWLGEGLGGILTGAANPTTGAPGAVIIYALLAVLLWPAGEATASQRGTDRHGTGPGGTDRDRLFTAARPVGARPARLLWLALWGSLAWFAVLAVNRTPQGLHDMVTGMAAGEPGWIARLDHGAASLLAGQGALVSAVLALLLATIAAGIFLPPPWARAVVLLAAAVAMAIWVIGENFGMIFAGSATDPNSGLPLLLLAAAYWPASPART
jgi:hypothetical protein